MISSVGKLESYGNTYLHCQIDFLDWHSLSIATFKITGTHGIVLRVCQFENWAWGRVWSQVDALPEAPGAHTGAKEFALLAVAFTLGSRAEGSFSGEALAFTGAVLFNEGVGCRSPAPPQRHHGKGVESIRHQTNGFGWEYLTAVTYITVGLITREIKMRFKMAFPTFPGNGGTSAYLLIPSCRLPIWCEQLCLTARFHLATSRVNLMKWVVFWWPEGKKTH